ncbi:MAG: lamin tail domain-containing protein [Cyanophyceae cyanobacterium]
MVWKRFVLAMACFLVVSFNLPLPVWAQPTDVLTIISYNVESDDINDTNPQQVAEDIQQIEPADLWGLSEVRGDEDAQVFQEAISRSGVNYESRISETGGSDRLQILFNPQRLRLIESEELSGFGGTRSPLVGRFEFLPNKQEFLFTVNHFNRGDEQKRQRQAENLRNWAREQTLPVIAAGDYNFDVSIQTQEGNEAYRIFTQDDTFTWLKPPCLSSGTCPPTGTQCDSRFDSILDFVFLAGEAKQWRAESQILFQEQPVCEKEERGYSDHYPVAAQIQVDVVSSTANGGADATPNIGIAALLPNPEGDESLREAATLVNNSQEAVNLAGWQLRDRTGLTWQLDLLGTLQPGEQRQLLREGQDMALNNDGDTVELISPQGEVVDTVSYGRADSEQLISFD